MSINKIVALEQGNPLNSTGAELAVSLNSTIDLVESPAIGNQKLRADIDAIAPSESNLTDAQRLFDKQANENIGMTCIVSGDSHRNNSYNNMIEYYNVLLNQVGVTVVNNAASGQSGFDWLNNDTGGGGTTLQQAINATSGTGSTTLLEYSFGVNDSGTEADIKAALKGGIEAYLAAKPDATVVLCSPVRTGFKNTTLIKIYEEISAELGLQLVKPHHVIEPYDNDPAFKQDTEHLNAYGSQRLLHFILSNIVSEKVRSSIKIPDLGVPTAPATNLNVVVQSGYWQTSDGSYSSLATWRSSEKIDVEPNYTIQIEHRGPFTTVIWYDGSGQYVGKADSTLVSGDVREVKVPVGAFQMVFNITDDGDTWDALGYTPEVKYVIEPVTYMTPEQVNVNMSAGLPRFNTLPVDSEGKTGSAGQFLMAVGAGKTKWANPVVVSTSPPSGVPSDGELVYHYANNNTVTTYVNINGDYVPIV